MAVRRNRSKREECEDYVEAEVQLDEGQLVGFEEY
jgi:hypothetical protein